MTQGSKASHADTTGTVRRGRRNRRGCGCFAFCLGAGATLVAFAPLLFGRLVMENFVEQANTEIAGELELGDVALSWTGTQRLDGLRLRDPEGRTVAEFDLEVPSIWQLMRAAAKVQNGEAGDYGKLLGTVELALVTGPDAPSNLERAMAPRSGSKPEVKSGSAQGSGGPNTGAADAEHGGRELELSVDTSIRLARLELELQVKHFSWSDPRLDAGGRAVGVKDMVARLAFEPERPARLTVRGEHLYGDQHAPLAVDSSIDVNALIVGERWHDAISGVVSLEDLPTPVFDRFFEAEGELLAALGQSFDIDVRLGETSANGQRLTASVQSEQQSLQLEARLADGLVHSAEGAPTRLDLRVPTAWLEAALADSLPEDMHVLAADGGLPLSVEVKSLALPLARATGWQSAALTLRVGLPALGIERTGFDPLDLRDGALDVVMTPDGPLEVEFSMREARGGVLGLTLRLPPGWQALAQDTATAAQLDYRARITLTDLPAARLESFVALDGELSELVTEPLQLALQARPGADESVQVEVELDSGGNQLRAAATLTDEFIEFAPGSTQLTLGLTTQQLVALIGESWPEGFELGSESGRVRAQAFVREARWPLGGGLGTATVEARLGPLALTNEALRAADERVALRSFQLTTRLDGAQPVEVDVDLALDLDGGAAKLKLSSLQTLAGLQGGEDATWLVTLNGTGLRTKLVDVLAAQDGLLLDVFGPTLQLDVDVRDWKAGAARIDARLDSSNAQLAWAGRLEDGVLRSSGDTESLQARVRLTPLFQERIVGNLLPMLVGMQSIEGADPALVRVTDFSMPLSGADRSVLAGLQADVRLELGRVRAAVLPGLAAMLSSQVHQLRPTQLPTLELKIRDGVVLADAIPIEIEKTPVVFAGNYALVDERMEFTCSVPLSGLRGDVGQVLNEARAYLDPNLLVPLRVHGRPDRPQVGIDSDFLKQVLRDGSKKAAGDALEKGLRKLFGND